MKRKDTGASRGFAFVEFDCNEEAQAWMETQQGVLWLEDYEVSMHFSAPRESVRPPDCVPSDIRTDWSCFKCGVHNFKKRDFCFRCNISREESDRLRDGGDGYDQMGVNPCNTLLFRGLDALTTEEKLCDALHEVAACQIANVSVIRDTLTSVSKGFAFVELSSVAESKAMLEYLRDKPLEIDGKVVMAHFAKNTFSTTMATLNRTSVSFPSAAAVCSSRKLDVTYDRSTGLFTDHRSGQTYDYATYFKMQEEGKSTNAAAAVAQAAIQQAQQAKLDRRTKLEKVTEQKSESYVSPPTGDGLTSYSIPDISTYTYDEKSGYYYDPATGLYYDSNSQYYFNSYTQAWLYWDATRMTYLPASSASQSSSQIPKQNNTKKEKVKVANKIAKDMEKWAKKMNQTKDAEKEAKAHAASTNRLESATSDIGASFLDKVVSEEETQVASPNGSSSTPSNTNLVAQYGGDSDSGDEQGELTACKEEQLTDWSKLACLLCKRQFNSKEILQKHNAISDLHKKNLEEWRLRNSAPKYRDRAAERRQKYGQPEPPKPNRGGRFERFEPESTSVPYEQPTADGINNDNIGSKLLQKMGWSEGRGLGRKGQGIQTPIKAEMRQSQAGLGARGAAVSVEPGDSYRDTVKKAMYARYHQLDS
ncbi:DgyrCDS7726 [Dimorphilus gyrociliatus]|nr:DgyrCDS7726 [Dimorphilus gyrociliatus]